MPIDVAAVTAQQQVSDAAAQDYRFVRPGFAELTSALATKRSPGSNWVRARAHDRIRPSLDRAAAAVRIAFALPVVARRTVALAT